MHEPGMMCQCSHHKIVPVCIVLIGLVFLLRAWGMVSASFLAQAWPALLIVIGAMKMSHGMCKCDMKK